MTSRTIAAIVAAAGAVSAAQQPPRFKTSTSLVRLEVSVTDDRGAVRGLTREDFVVLDRGVEQTVRVDESVDAPLDLVLVVQPMASVAYTSGRILEDAGFVADPEPVFRMGAALSAFLDGVRERDRLGVLLAGAPPTRLRALEYGRPSFDAGAFAGGAYAAPFDAIAAALREFPNADRRRALIAFTNAGDFRSIIRFGTLAEMTRRLGPQFVIVGTPVKIDEHSDARAVTATGRPIGDPMRGVVSGSIFPESLQLLARRSGGITVNLGSSDPRRLIEDMFAWLRTQYVISYEPPAGKGWHPVNVSVTRRGASVMVREGYFVD